MKRIGYVVVLSLFMVACSKSPMNRLKAYEPNNPKTFLTKEDEAYWKRAKENNTREFQEAVTYCKDKPTHITSGCFLINDILNAPEVIYGQYPVKSPKL